MAASLAAVSLVAVGCAGTRSATPDTGAATGIDPLGAAFLFGMATASFQVERATPDSNWSRYANSGAVTHPVGDATDFYHRYNDDIVLARGLGAEVFRISVEWTRLQPNPGERDPTALKYYDRVLASIRAADMRPMITPDHSVYPGWKSDQGG
ncbi:family 1 glycosylhydrolase [Nocardia sp. NPDC056000]|uniref:family 1 glycosylhydrolase n=1 Tax=Nocardia sp. NPDC056000 TaxID=3345674 RepID=UPI0035D56373